MVVAKKKQSELVPEEVKSPKTKVQNTSTADSVVEGTSTFSVKLDTKKFESRTLEQVLALVQGSAGATKKIVIEKNF